MAGRGLRSAGPSPIVPGGGGEGGRGAARPPPLLGRHGTHGLGPGSARSPRVAGLFGDKIADLTRRDNSRTYQGCAERSSHVFMYGFVEKFNSFHHKSFIKTSNSSSLEDRWLSDLHASELCISQPSIRLCTALDDIICGMLCIMPRSSKNCFAPCADLGGEEDRARTRLADIGNERLLRSKYGFGGGCWVFTHCSLCALS